MYSRFFWVGDFKYAIQNFKGAKGVAMATKFGKNKPKLHRLHFCARNRGLFRTNTKVFWVGEFTYAIQNFE